MLHTKRKPMNNLTWLDLYNFLHRKANDINNLGKFHWNEPVIVHDAATGDEYNCDTWEINDSNSLSDKLVMLINIEHIYNENI